MNLSISSRHFDKLFDDSDIITHPTLKQLKQFYELNISLQIPEMKMCICRDAYTKDYYLTIFHNENLIHADIPQTAMRVFCFFDAVYGDVNKLGLFVGYDQRHADFYLNEPKLADIRRQIKYMWTLFDKKYITEPIPFIFNDIYFRQTK